MHKNCGLPWWQAGLLFKQTVSGSYDKGSLSVMDALPLVYSVTTRVPFARVMVRLSWI
jgi:hypothetical protein